MFLAHAFEFAKGLIVPSWYNYVPQIFLPYGVVTLPMLSVVKFVIYKTIFAVSHVGTLFNTVHDFWSTFYDNITYTDWDAAEFVLMALVAYSMYRIFATYKDKCPLAREPEVPKNLTKKVK